MPSPSVQAQLHHALNAAAFAIMTGSDTDCDLETDIDFIQYLLQKRYLISRRPMSRHLPKYELQIIEQLPSSSMLQIFRTTWPCFLKLVNLIEDHPVFHNNSYHPQRDPSTQIAVALCRLGSNGNAAAKIRLNNLFSIGYRTVEKYTQRVIMAIQSLKLEIVSWPTAQQRLESSQVMQEEGFPGCIGFVDGTTIPLSQKPAIDGNHYFD